MILTKTVGGTSKRLTAQLLHAAANIMQQIEAFADLAGLAAHSPPIVDSAHFTLPIKRPTAKDLKSLDKTQPPRQPSTNLASSSSITLPSAQRFFSQLRAILQLGSENFMSKTTNPRSSYRSSGDSAVSGPTISLVVGVASSPSSIAHGSPVEARPTFS